jgi:hypothetical protein
MPTTKGIADMYLALRKTPGQVTGPHFHLTAEAVLILAGLVLLFLAVYRISLFLFPHAMCRRCGGSGKVKGWYPGSAAFCRKCNGSGVVPRLGTLVTDGAGGRRARC